MKVKIYEYLNADKPWRWEVTIGGVKISRDYTSRRACVRGLWRWYFRAEEETTNPAVAWSMSTWETIQRAIRESRVKP